LATFPEGPLIVGIAGGTASGKTTLVRRAAMALGRAGLWIQHDRYYLDVVDPRSHNYDHPDALDTPRLIADLDSLRAGLTTELPDYDFKTHTRRALGESVRPCPVLLVEGILVLADPELRKRFDLTFFVQADDDLRLARRLSRDIAERGRTADDVLRQYLETVRPMHKRFVAPSRAHAEHVLDGEGDLNVELGRLLEAIRGARGLPSSWPPV
jgi:uridine kinase